MSANRKMKYFLSLTTIIMASTFLLSAQATAGGKADTTKTKKKLAYHSAIPTPTQAGLTYGDHPRQVLDFWQAEAEQPTALVVVIHGGGWLSGSKERLDRFVDTPTLLQSGISVAAINYRLISHANAEGVVPPVKAPLHDAARAVQFLRSKADELNIDPTRIGAAGGSAGACSSLWLAFHEDLADERSADPVLRESSRLTCAAVIGAQTTLDPKQMVAWTPNSKYGGHAFGKKDFAEFLDTRDTILPWIQEYSPYALVSKDDPPVALFYGPKPAIGQAQKDPTHTSNFGLKLQEHCQRNGVECEFIHDGIVDPEYPNTTSFFISKLK